MPVKIPRHIVEFILLGPAGDRRQIQDSPVLADVWLAFAEAPDKPQELLITPHNSKSAGSVACKLDDMIFERRQHGDRGRPNFSYLQGIVAAQLYFDEVLELIVPVTEWWDRLHERSEMNDYFDQTKGAQRLSKSFAKLVGMLKDRSSPVGSSEDDAPFILALDRYAVLAGVILWAKDQPDPSRAKQPTDAALIKMIAGAGGAVAQLLTEALIKKLEQTKALRDSANRSQQSVRDDLLVYQVSLNRKSALALTKSVAAVKADAANLLFKVDCSTIAWAVVDSGVNASHPSFRSGDKNCPSRVRDAFDFSRYRDIVSLDNRRIFDPDNPDNPDERLERLRLVAPSLTSDEERRQAGDALRQLAENVRHDRPIDWKLVESFVRIDIGTAVKTSDHGTHVAGIIGAGTAFLTETEKATKDYTNGMCPNIKLYDFRVISGTIKDTEYAVIAALQYIRYINRKYDFITIHGVNLSLSIPHEVRNYACGRTPICLECERLIESGVVVVAAAGNHGYRTFGTGESAFDSYSDQTITDPGNADGVITVGSTHRFSPHTYGVSFFSSRGPTGDGRRKPDLVAPGERIRAPFRQGWGDLDGTSMAAPHVSGAAAMLMARYSELLGQPRRIKAILCESATDLGRERNFQGHGMLDVLRAFQSI